MREAFAQVAEDEGEKTFLGAVRRVERQATMEWEAYDEGTRRRK